MKANAPEKIWIDPTTDLSKLSGHIDNDSVEYFRKDAFINKATDWLFNQANIYTKLNVDYHNGSVCADFYADKMVEDFRKYIEGE